MRSDASPAAAPRRRRAVLWTALGLCAALLLAPVVLHFALRWQRDLGPLYAGVARLRDQAQELSRRARTFDQRTALDALGANAKNGFVHRFDEHLADLHTVPLPGGGARPLDAKPLLAIELEGADAVTLASEKGVSSVEGGVLRTTFAPGDVLVTRGELALDPERVGQLVLRVKHARGTQMTIGWRSEGELQNKQTINLLPLHGEWYEYRLSTATLFQDTLWPFTPKEGAESARSLVRELVIEPSDVPGDQVEIDYLRLTSKRARYGASPFGESYETIAKEMRKVVYANTPLALETTLALPAGPLRFETGFGVLEGGDPVRFRVALKAGELERELVSRTVQDGAQWFRVELDVSEFAGRTATVRFEAASESGNVAFWSNPAIRGPARERLDVVLLLEDALRADRLSCAGYTRPTTPNKDRLAQESCRFLRCYSQETKTRMSMPSLMTSLYPTATGVWNFHEVLNDSYLTLAEILRSQGFETASFTQNPNAGAGAGLHQGFSYLFELDKTVARPEEVYAAAERWMAERKDQNLFLYLHVIDPHSPYDPPAPFDRWAKELGPGGTAVKKLDYYDPDWVTAPTKEGRRALYDGEVAHDDARFGEFRAWLEGEGRLDGTLLVNLADHGEFLGEHQMWDHRTPGFAPVLHVPLIVRFPGHVPAGKVLESPVQLLDLAPTVLELAGIGRAPLLLQGESLVPLMQQGDSEAWRRRVVVSDEVNDRSDKGDERALASLFYGDLHLLNSHQFSVNRRWPSSLYLRTFDARADPAEDGRGGALAWDAIHKLRVAGLLGDLQAANVGVWLALTHGVSGAMDYDPEMIERLRSLGYL